MGPSGARERGAFVPVNSAQAVTAKGWNSGKTTKIIGIRRAGIARVGMGREIALALIFGLLLFLWIPVYVMAAGNGEGGYNVRR